MYSFRQALWSRYMPLYDVIRKELTKDNLGEIRIVRADLTSPIDISDDTFMSLSHCGGALLCLGLYPVQFATLVFNEMPEKIVAVGNLASTGKYSASNLELRYDGVSWEILPTADCSTCRIRIKL